MSTSVSMNGMTHVEVNDSEIRSLPAVQKAIERVKSRGMRVTAIEVVYRVPGGGDWSGMESPVDEAHPVTVKISSSGEFKDE